MIGVPLSKSRVHLWLPLLYLVVGVSWVLGSDFVLSESLLGPGAESLVGSLKGVIFVALSALLIYVVTSRQPAPDVARVLPKARRRSLRRPVAIFLIAGLGIGASGWIVYWQQSAMIREEAADDLSTIGELKAQQIEQWLDDRQSAVEHAGRNEALAELELDASPEHAATDARLRAAILESLRDADDFRSVQMVSLDGEPIDAAGVPIPITARLKRLMLGARITGRVVRSDLYVPDGEARAEPVIDFVVALSDPRAPGDQNVAVLIARSPAAAFLDPLLANWPSHAASGESILYRRERDRALFLTRPRLAQRQPLADSVPLSDDRVAVVRIIDGERGPLAAIDYRGRPVLEFGRQIRGTGWYLVSKIDQSELYGPLRQLMLLAISLGLIALSATAGLVLLWWRGERLALSLRVNAAERRAAVLEEHFALAGRFINDAVLLYDASGRIVEVNDRAEAMYGYTRYEMLRMHLNDLRPAASPEGQFAEREFRAVMESGHTRPFVSRIWCKDGSTLPVEISPRVFSIDGRVFVQSIVRDISERVQNEARIAQISAERDRVLADLQLQFERMPTGCIVSDPGGRFVKVNPAFERIFGYSEAEFRAAEPFALIVPEPQRTELAARLAALAHAESPVAIVSDNVTRSGRHITCRWTNTPLRDDAGRLTGILAMCEDITERVATERALRASEERYRALAEVSPVGIFRTDAAGRLVYLNRRGCEISGLTAEQCLGDGWKSVLHPLDGAAVLQVWRSFQAPDGHNVQPTEFRILRPDGTMRWVLPQVLPELSADGGVSGYVGTVTDITVLKQAQMDLREARDHLEERVAERTRELEIARDEAERADRVKTAFLSTVSHELRTPLNSILGFTDVVLDGLSGPLNDVQHRQLAIVRDSSVHLRSLIEDVLDISRIEAGQLGLEIGEFDLADLLRRRVASFEPEAARKKLALQAQVDDELALVRSDERRVGQILNNLLSNAVKFTTAGSVELIATVRGARVRIEVRDTGPGIAPEDLDKLFKPFSQVTRPGGRLHEGTGLGLAISRQLARALGGDVTVVSEPGRGSTFSLELPLNVDADWRPTHATGIFRRDPALH